MLRFVYQILFVIFFIISLPYYTWRMFRRGNFRHHFFERFGIYNQQVIEKLSRFKKPLWIHAVSVGEAMLAQVLLQEIRKRKPELEVILTTTTQTGRQVAEKMVDERTVVVYAPMDFLLCIKRAFCLFKPAVLVLVEAEIWPNWIWLAKDKNIPVCMINGRLSDRSMRRYSKIRFFSRSLLEYISWIGLQFEADRERYRRAGFPAERLFLTGSMKFDVAGLRSINEALVPQLRQLLGWREGDEILLAGSTHIREEALLLDIFQALKKPNLKLILAPRHAERAEEVAAECRAKGVSYIRRSELRKRTEQLAEDEQVDAMILDTTGELGTLYSWGTVQFIGKSIRGHGGQNFIEAVRFGRPVIFGPNMENFPQQAALFVKEKGVIQVQSDEELRQAIEKLLSNSEYAKNLGEQGRAIFEKNLGAAQKTAEMILQFPGLS